MGLLYTLREGARLWAPCTRSRRYHAALATLAAIHRFPQLDAPAKSRIDTELVQIYKPLGIYPWWRFRRDLSPTVVAADHAVAMHRLGIATGIAELKWEDLLHPWHRQSPGQLGQDFSASHIATDEAVQYLVSKGVPLAEIAPFGKRWLEQARVHDA